MGPKRVTIERKDGALETRTDIVVVPGRAAESRRVIVSNSSNVETQVELTSYQEVVLATQLLDRGHRAFFNLFVQTEWLPDSGSILAMRRPRSKEVKPSWGGHTIAVQSDAGPISCETDRVRFIGRGRTSRNPVAMGNAGDLSGTVGAVLDPVFSLRTNLTIAPGKSAHVIFSTFAAEDRDDAIRLAESFSDWTTAASSFQAVSHGEEGTGPRASAADAALYQDLAGLLLYGVRSAGRVDEGAGSDSSRSDLLAIGITGEWPIVLATVTGRIAGDRITELLALHGYWRSKGLAADLVILLARGDGSPQLHDIVEHIVQSSSAVEIAEASQGVFIRSADALRKQDVALLESVARIRIDLSSETLNEIARG